MRLMLEAVEEVEEVVVEVGVVEVERCSDLEVEEPQVAGVEVGRRGRTAEMEEVMVRRSKGSVVCVTSRVT